MKKYLLLGVFAFLFIGAGVAFAHSSVNNSSSFTLNVGEHVEVANYQNMKIELLNIGASTGGCPVGADSRCLGEPPLLGSSLDGAVRIKVSTAGGCGPNADPRCLGGPAYENILSLPIGGYVNALGLKITVANITDTSAAFKVTSSDDEDLVLNPPALPVIKFKRISGTQGTVSASAKLIVCPNGVVGENCSSCANGNCVPVHANSQSSSSPRLILLRGETLISVLNATSTATTSVEYKVKVKKKARVFYIFPVSSEIIYSVNASTGAKVVISRPWWSALAW